MTGIAESSETTHLQGAAFANPHPLVATAKQATD
jgi:hypothetical protein